MEDVKRLPKWAQHKIRNLELNLAAREDKTQSILGNKETKIAIEGYGIHPESFLPERSQVTFYVGEGKRQRIQVGFNTNYPNALTVYATGGRLAFMPNAANTGHMKVVD